MRPRKYTTEKIIVKLREAEVLISQGMDAYEASRQIGVSRQTFVWWNACRSSQKTEGPGEGESSVKASRGG